MRGECESYVYITLLMNFIENSDIDHQSLPQKEDINKLPCVSKLQLHDTRLVYKEIFSLLYENS